MKSSALEPELPPVEEATVRANGSQLQRLAEQFGITQLRFSSPGRLVGHVSRAKDLLDVVEFEIAASEMLEASVELLSNAVLAKANISPDLLSAQRALIFA